MDSKDELPVIIPAQLGFDRAEYCIDEQGKVIRIEWHPIIAWCIKEGFAKGCYNDITPVAVEGSSSVSEAHPVVRYPDGRVLAPGDRDFHSEAEVIEFFQKYVDLEK